MISVRSNCPMFSLLIDRKSTRLNSSHLVISYAVFCLKKNKAHRTSWPAGVARVESAVGGQGVPMRGAVALGRAPRHVLAVWGAYSAHCELASRIVDAG